MPRSKVAVPLAVTARAGRRQWASPWLLVHRGDLHGELMGLVRGEGRVDVRLGARIVEVDAESGRVVLDDGTVFEGDAIIGADGNNSIARRSVDPDARLRAWGKSCYRFLVGREVLRKDEATRGLVEEDGYFLDVLAMTGSLSRILVGIIWR